jgi:hypothetical protein
LTRETLVGRASRVLRRNGPAGLAFAALRPTVYYRVNLIEKGLPRPSSDVLSQAALEVTRLTPEDVGAYCRYRPESSPQDVARRLERGSLCYVSWKQGRIVSCGWYHPREAWIEDLDRRFELPPDCVYLYDGHTSPELRGRGISSARATATWADLRRQGFRRGVAFVVAGNRSSDRASAKAGWRRFGVAGYARLGPWRLEFIRSRGRHTLWRIRRTRPSAAKRGELPPLEPAEALLGQPAGLSAPARCP